MPTLSEYVDSLFEIDANVDFETLDRLDKVDSLIEELFTPIKFKFLKKVRSFSIRLDIHMNSVIETYVDLDQDIKAEILKVISYPSIKGDKTHFYDFEDPFTLDYKILTEANLMLLLREAKCDDEETREAAKELRPSKMKEIFLTLSRFIRVNVTYEFIFRYGIAMERLKEENGKHRPISLLLSKYSNQHSPLYEDSFTTRGGFYDVLNPYLDIIEYYGKELNALLRQMS